MPDIARRLIKNTLFNFLGRFVSRLANFFLVPYILHKIGIGEFGLFSLLNVFFYFANLADLGTGTSIVRFITADLARSDMESLGRRVFGQLLFCFAITILLAAVLEALGSITLGFFHLAASDLVRMHCLVVTFIIAMGIGCIANVFQSILLGYQRMDLTNAIGIILVLPNVVGTVLLLQMGFGLEGLVWVFFGVQVLGLILTWIVADRVCPQLHWAQRWPDKTGFVQTVHLGLQAQWVRIVSTFSRTLDQILLAPMMGLSAVTTYALASKPVLLIQEAGALIVSATVPVVAHLDTQNSQLDKQRIGKLLRRSQRYIDLFVGVALCGFLALSGFLVRAWLGPEYSNVSGVMKLLACGHLVSLLTAPGINELMGKGNMTMLAPILTVQIISQIFLSWWFIKVIGLLGPAIALCTAVGYGTLHFLIVFYRSRTMSLPGAERRGNPVVIASRSLH